MANWPVTSYICGGGWLLLLLYFTGDDGDLLSANDFNWMFGCLGCQTDCTVEGVTVSVFSLLTPCRHLLKRTILAFGDAVLLGWTSVCELCSNFFHLVKLLQILIHIFIATIWPNYARSSTITNLHMCPEMLNASGRVWLLPKPTHYRSSMRIIR